MKSVNSNSILGVMRLFSNEEYYKYAFEVLWILRSTAMKSIECNGRGGIYWDTKHPNFWIAEVTNEIIGRALISDCTYVTVRDILYWYGERRRGDKDIFLTYDEARRIACIVNNDKLMGELYRLRDSVSC